MRFSRFRTLAASFGGDFRRWPDKEREAAHALLAKSSDARAIIDDALAFDRALANASAVSDARLDDPPARSRASEALCSWSTQLNRPPGGPPLMRALTNAEHSLSPADADTFRTILRRDAPRYFAASLQLAEARRVLEAQVTSEHFSAAAAQAAFANWRAAFDNFTHAFQAPLIDALAGISADGRHRLVAERRVENPPTTP
jgi:hypothetical protein